MMIKARGCIWRVCGVALVALSGLCPRLAAQVPLDQAWDQLPHYEYGQDMAGLLALEREVIDVMQSPARRSQLAARLARVLDDPATTPAARQFICSQLRQVGTAAEVPVLARWLTSPETGDMARAALAAIPGPAPLAALREARPGLAEQAQIGVINSLGVRRDAESVPVLMQLADAPHAAVREAALRALANVADPSAIAFLHQRAARGGEPWVRELAQCLAQAAAVAAQRGDRETAAAIYQRLAAAGQRPELRTAALEGLLQLETDGRVERLRGWLYSQDGVERQIAMEHLATLPDAELDTLAQDLAGLPEASGEAVLEVLARRRHAQLRPLALQWVQRGQPAEQLLGLRYLALLEDPQLIPVLIAALGGEEPVAAAARRALVRQPRDETGHALLAALATADAAARPRLIASLGDLRFYEAIDPLVALAAETDPAVYGPALDGLQAIADPDQPDLSRLLDLLPRTPQGAHRDAVEKTIAAVCEKTPAGTDRGELLVALIGDGPTERWQLYLPLLGRVGGAAAWQVLEPRLQDADPATAEAAVRGLCHWPTAEVADRIWAVATGAGDAGQRRRALRSFVRVIGLPSDRPPDVTLARLQAAMQQATLTEDQALILSRAATVRTMECVRWIAPYLDNPALAQAACRSLAALAHHRELRHPHLDEFRPLLARVAEITDDATIAERARRYQLGL